MSGVMTGVTAEPEQIELDAGGYRFHALSQAPLDHAKTEQQPPLMLCLHGFPDCPATFINQMRTFSEQGFRVVAPYQRGYHPDTLSPDNRYQTIELAQDALNLIDALGYEQAVVFGHDWGASIASGTAVLAPEKVTALITAALPYGGKLGELLLTDPEQQRRSWYMFFFQTALAEMAVAQDNMAFIRRLWQDWSPGWQFPEAQLQAVIDTLSEPGVLNAAITYYRCALDPDYQREEIAALQGRIGEVLSTPTLHLHGGNDGCIGVSATENMANMFSGPFELELIPHAGHFLHQEDAPFVNARVLKFLDRHTTLSASVRGAH